MAKNGVYMYVDVFGLKVQGNYPENVEMLILLNCEKKSMVYECRILGRI